MARANTIIQKLQIIKDQKNALKSVISGFGFNVKDLKFNQYSDRLSAVQDNCAKMVDVLSSAGFVQDFETSSAV